MSRFYFDLRNGNGLTRDEEGQEIERDELSTHATQSIRSVLSEEVRGGTLDLAGCIEVRDEAGETVLVMPFADALTLRLAEPR